MKRNSSGQSHKIKTSMTFGLRYPVMSKEVLPGDITRIDPEVIVKSVVPPTVPITDKIKYYIDFFFTPDRLTDDHFVRNMTTTTTGEVKGNFKSLSLKQISDEFGGSTYMGSTENKATRLDSLHAVSCPSWFPLAEPSDIFSTGSEVGHLLSDENSGGEVTTCFEVASGKRSDGKYVKGAKWFGSGSLMDYLNLHVNANLGSAYDGSFRTNHISSYYMICNFYYTDPEYQKYLAPHFDYVYPGRDNSENRETLHRYETLEDEFGVGFEEPHCSGRCFRGLVFANWGPDRFSKSLRDAQRGTAPKCPVTINGNAPVFLTRSGAAISPQNPLIMASSSPNGQLHGIDSGNYFNAAASLTSGSIDASFVVSDLRTTLALQHFAEDAQGKYKWSDWLQEMYGTSPVDLMIDQPKYLGGMSGFLTSSEVLQTVETEDGSLGDLGGHLSGYSRGDRITYRADEPGVLTAIMWIMPERNYESGVERKFTRLNYLDMFFKHFVGIGNQAIRLDEVTAKILHPDSKPINSNFGFEPRYNEFLHEVNRVTGKCRNLNYAMPTFYYDETLNAIKRYERDYTVSEIMADGGYNGVPILDFHPYAIGDSFLNGKAFEFQSNRGLFVTSNGNDFRLCIPQLNDIFTDYKSEPFMVTIGFNMDVFTQVPVEVRPGVQYV